MHRFVLPGRFRAVRRPALVVEPIQPPPLTIPELLAPSAAILADAMSQNSVRYSFEDSQTSNNTGGSQTNASNWGHCLAVVALAALAGNAAAAAKLLAQLLYWTDPAQDRMPAGDAGYKAQYEINAVVAIAIAKLIPAIWDDASLTAERKARLDLAMQGCLAGAAWSMSDANVWIGSFSTERTIMGFESGRDANPNFSSPPKLIIQIVAGYMGRSAAAAFLASFDRAAFSAACTAAGGLGKMATVYSQDWTPALVDAVYGKSSGARTGPTRSQLETAIRNYAYRGWGVTEADGALVLGEQLEYNFMKVIQVGPTGWGGSPYGIIGPTTQGELRAVIADTSAWAGLPNAGMIGAPLELDTINAGTPGLRASMSYVARGVSAVFVGMVALAAQGLHAGRAAALAEGVARVQRGVTHVRYLDRWGFKSYAKTGFNGEAWASNNENWSAAWASAAGFELPCRWGLGDCLVSALTGSRVDTSTLFP